MEWYIVVRKGKAATAPRGGEGRDKPTVTMSTATNANESYCTFTLASDTTAGGLPSQEEIAKQLESNDPKVRSFVTVADG